MTGWPADLALVGRHEGVEPLEEPRLLGRVRDGGLLVRLARVRARARVRVRFRARVRARARARVRVRVRVRVSGEG